MEPALIRLCDRVGAAPTIGGFVVEVVVGESSVARRLFLSLKVPF